MINRGAAATIGGTSAGTPLFAGIVALLNQYLVAKGVEAQPGLGNINPALYRLAQATTDVFHDIIDGDTFLPCQQGSPNCVNAKLGFGAGPGYDLATGLGSVDAYRMVKEWTAGTSTTTTVSGNPSTFALGGVVQLTAIVTGNGAVPPTGNVNFLANDSLLGGDTLFVTAGVARATITIDATRIAAGNGTVTAFYEGDGIYSGSAGSVKLTLQLPTTGSLVVPAIDPNPVYQVVDSWPYMVTLSEKAGVATRLTSFSVDGATQSLSLFSSVNIPAKGAVVASLAGVALLTPRTRTFKFSGVDAGGGTWTREIDVPFLPGSAPFNPLMTLTSAPSTVSRNPGADPNCPWSQQLTVQEQSGFFVQLNGFAAGSTDLSSSIQRIFGTTRLAPYGVLQGTLCVSSNSSSLPPRTIQVAGTSEIGSTVTASTTAFYAPAAPQPAAFSVSPSAVAMLADSASQNGGASVNLNFAGGANQDWTVAVVTSGHATNWLTVSPLSGTGPATLNIKAAGAGLSNGVYDATLVVQATNAMPQYANIRVIFVVGGSPSMFITDVSNGASPSPAFAPGMLVDVSGSQLALSEQRAGNGSTVGTSFLPFTMGGVSATVNGVSAPLYSISSEKVRLQIPYETRLGTAVLGINNNGRVAHSLLGINVASPAIFSNATGYMLPSSTGRRGQTVTAFITGDGDVAPFLATGATPISGTAASSLPQPMLPVTVTVGGVAAAVRFSGVPPGLVGVTQINFTIALETPIGVQPVIVRVGGIASSPANLTVN